MKKQVVTLTAILAFGSMNCFAATTADNLQNPTQVQQVQPQDQSNQQPTTAQTVSTDKASKKDAEILGILLVVDNNEVNAGKIAADKASNADVKQFAQDLQTDHSKNYQDTQDLATRLNVTPATSDKSKAIEAKGKKDADKLNTLSADKFDAIYVSAMIKGHQEVLKMINAWISKTKNQDVITHLKATREAVTNHLKTAQDLKKKLA